MIRGHDRVVAGFQSIGVRQGARLAVRPARLALACLMVLTLTLLAMGGYGEAALAQDLMVPQGQPANPPTTAAPAPVGETQQGAGMSAQQRAPEVKPAPPAPPAQPQNVAVKLEALLTADGQRIDQGLIWRVYADRKDTSKDAKSKLVGTWRDAVPQLSLPPGDYIVNAAYGRANLTKPISVKAGAAAVSERFVLNAGGLVLKAVVGNSTAPPSAVSYNILSDDRDQYGNRAVVMSNAKPGLIIRLNAGIYQIVSTYGDANATVRADVTVEAGKLTEATVAHTAARVTLKLVQRQGGEALADTLWSIQTAQGEVVKESVGALPTHTLAPGSYVAVAKSLGRTYRRDFVLQNGDTKQVEVMSE